MHTLANVCATHGGAACAPANRLALGASADSLHRDIFPSWRKSRSRSCSFSVPDYSSAVRSKRARSIPVLSLPAVLSPNWISRWSKKNRQKHAGSCSRRCSGHENYPVSRAPRSPLWYRTAISPMRVASCPCGKHCRPIQRCPIPVFLRCLRQRHPVTSTPSA